MAVVVVASGSGTVTRVGATVDVVDVAVDVADVAGPDLSEAEFEREWFLHLLSLALERLREESPRYHRALELTSLGDSSHAEAAAELGCSSRNVRNLVLRGKTLLGSLLRAEVLRYARSPAEQEAELAYLQRLLSST